MHPTITDIRKAGAKKIGAILRAEKGVLRTSSVVQKRLATYLASVFLPSFDIDEDGRIVNSSKNLKRIASASKLRKFIRDDVDKELLANYKTSFETNASNSVSYYDLFDVKSGTVNNIINRSNISKDAFLTELFDNNDTIKQLQTTIRANIITQTPFKDLKGLLNEQVKGTEDKLGLIESYHYREGIEEFQTYSRGLDQQFSKALKLNYAIYAGTEIRTTRVFCDDRVGNVYNRETILEWNDLDFQGKKKNHNILIDLGGYNCRHDLNWISYQLAKRLNKDIERSTFDK